MNLLPSTEKGLRARFRRSGSTSGWGCPRGVGTVGKAARPADQTREQQSALSFYAPSGRQSENLLSPLTVCKRLQQLILVPGGATKESCELPAVLDSGLGMPRIGDRRPWRMQETGPGVQLVFPYESEPKVATAEGGSTRRTQQNYVLTVSVLTCGACGHEAGRGSSAAVMVFSSSKRHRHHGRAGS